MFAGGCAALNNIGNRMDETPTPDPPTDSGVNVSDIGTPPEGVYGLNIDDEITLDPGRYKYWERDLSETIPTTVSSTVVVRSGPPIDYILTDKEEMQALQDGERWAYYDSSELQTTLVDEEWRITDTEQLVIIIDNSNYAELPDNELPAEVDVEVEFN